MPRSGLGEPGHSYATDYCQLERNRILRTKSYWLDNASNYPESLHLCSCNLIELRFTQLIKYSDPIKPMIPKGGEEKRRIREKEREVITKFPEILLLYLPDEAEQTTLPERLWSWKNIQMIRELELLLHTLEFLLQYTIANPNKGIPIKKYICSD